MTRSDDAPHHHDPAELHNEDVAHEHSDVNIRAILMFAAGLAVVTVVVQVLMAVLFNVLENSARENDPQLTPLAERAPEMPKTTTESPTFGYARGGAHLLTNEPMALEKLRSDETKRLETYGWVDGKPGVAHMPIGEAKKLILERGVPVRAGDPLDPALGTHAAAIGESSGGRAIPTGNAPQQPAGAPERQQPGQQPAQPPAAGPHGPAATDKH